MSPEEIFKTMQKLIVEQFALDPDEVTMDSSFEEDLGADSVDLVELVMAMEEEFELDEIPGGAHLAQDGGRLRALPEHEARLRRKKPPRFARGVLLSGGKTMQALEEKLQYHFKNPALLEEALRHSSYANEHRGANFFSNERLEFLGDSVLGFVTAEYLFAKHPTAPEGELTRIRALLVCEDSLHEVAQRLELGKYLKLGNGEESCGGRTRPSILADATEAVFAAVYLDGGISAASALIHRVLLDTEREEVAEETRRDYKTILQEFVQRTPNQTLSYRLFGESGPDHDKTFYFEVLLNGGAVGKGAGRSKKEAEQMAAKDALEKLTDQR